MNSISYERRRNCGGERVKRGGVADLKLHPGKAPHWLVKRMIPMAEALCEFIVDEYGTHELLKRLSDPVYFQALANVLGYDWDSSGSTTVTCGVLKSALSFERHGVVGIGGKGASSLRVPERLRSLEDYGLDGAGLGNVSKAVAKVDNAGVQDGYNLYQHVFFVDADSNWTVVQQGMDTSNGDARRYHWTSEVTKSYIHEPHTGLISGRVNEHTMDMTSGRSSDCRKTSVDVVRDGPRSVKKHFQDIKAYGESTLLPWIEESGESVQIPSYKVLPTRMDWAAVRRAYETQPKGYEELLLMDGIGPATVRGLSLISEMIFGSPPAWSDPVRMCFAFGGKDGVPFPVPRKAYDQAIDFLQQVLRDAKVGRKERVLGLKRLSKFAPPILRTSSQQA
ncbi:DUF763 domain-containing protein [Candidatus Thorarchaeota archaeon]|nr:MAG: DUF763 domain-containing protein [Candidatus Thorarchaeota archaeon]